jgi:Protein of unknown function (DUF2569)
MERTEQAGRVSGGRSLLGMPHAGAQAPKGIGGWLLVYVIGRVALLPHQLQLTLGAIVIFADPAVAGLRTYVPLSSLLLYEATNWLLVGLTVVALVLIRRRSRAAIPVNLALSGLWFAALVVWQFLGLKSPAGTIIDATPALFGLWYFLTSKRVRNTFTHTGRRAAEERRS